MKKIISLMLAVLMLVGTMAMFASCGGKTTYVAKAIEGVDVERYGYCISKTASNHDSIMAAINEVIANTDIDAVVTYYTELSGDKEPSAKLEMPNLADNTAGKLDIYTCSGFEPYEFIDSDGSTVIGVDIYLMTLVAEKLNMTMEVHDVDFDGIVGSIATKDNAIGAAGITITDDRKKSVDFSDPYFSSVQYIISKEDEAFTDLAKLAGKVVGVQKGTTGCTLVTDAVESGVLKDTNTTILEYDTGAVAFTAMKQGKCEYVVLDELPALKLVSKQ